MDIQSYSFVLIYMTNRKEYHHISNLSCMLFLCRKLLMRWTVLSSDALMFFPAVLCFVIAYFPGQSRGRKSSIAWHIAMILLNPCLILIDHGHFQVGNKIYCCIYAFLLPLGYLCLCHNWKIILNHIVFHWQYNCISLGLTVGAVAAILSDRDLVASVLFSLALNHKQVLSSHL